jgi:hypothetical protein
LVNTWLSHTPRKFDHKFDSEFDRKFDHKFNCKLYYKFDRKGEQGTVELGEKTVLKQTNELSF